MKTFIAAVMTLLIGPLTVTAQTTGQTNQVIPDPPQLINLVTSQPPTWVSLYWKAKQKASSGHFPFSFEIAGSDTGTPGYGVGLYVGAKTGRAGSHMYAFNTVIERAAGDPVSLAFGAEISTNNYAANDDRDAWPGMIGLTIVQGGPFSPRAAMLIGSATGVPFRNAIDIMEGAATDYVIRYGSKFQVLTNGTVWVNTGGVMEQLVPASWLNALDARVRRLELR